MQPPHPLVASRTHAVPVVWSSIAKYFYGHPIPRTDRQCTRRGRDSELLGGRPTLFCTHHTRLSRRGRRPYPWFGLLWPNTSLASPSPRTDRQCTRPGRDSELLGGRPTLVCTHHTRLSRRGRTPYPWFGLLWPHTSMATQFRARTASARGPVGMRNCWGDARHWFAPTPPACRVGDARRTRGLDFYGHILLWPPNSAHGPPVHAAR